MEQRDTDPADRRRIMAEAVAAIRARVEALQRMQTMDPKEPYGCAAMERGHRYFADFGRLGEVAAAQRALTAGQQNSK